MLKIDSTVFYDGLDMECKKKMKEEGCQFFFCFSNRKNEDLEYGLSRYNRSDIQFGVHESSAVNQTHKWKYSGGSYI